MPNLLACCGALPAHVEHWIPSLREAERRGWQIWFAVEGHWVGPYLRSQGFRTDRMIRTGGIWKGIRLIMPQAEKVFAEVKPGAAFVSPSGHGYPGGIWLEECHKRGVPAVEFLNACYPFVWWHGPDKRGLTGEYLKGLKEVGYGLEMHGCLTMTDVQQWVGLPIGDRLKERVNVRAALGLSRKKPYVLVSPPWTKDPKRAEELSDDLRLYLKAARASGRALVMSLHPNARYAEGAVEAVNVPKGIVLASCWPGMVWGREVKACPTMALIRESDFVIHTYRTGHSHLCLAAGKAMWLKRMMHAHSRKWTEKSLIAAFKGDRPPVTKRSFTVLFDQDLLVRFRAMESNDADTRRMRPFWDVPWYYRGEDALEGLFSGDLSDFSGTDKEQHSWQQEFQLRVDGEVAGRIVDLIE